MKPWAIMCCGCRKMMGPHGEALERVGSWFSAICFASKDEADVFALSVGWTTDGGNHRCPTCQQRLQIIRGWMNERSTTLAS